MSDTDSMIFSIVMALVMRHHSEMYVLISL